jgi:hypothetical protein
MMVIVSGAERFKFPAEAKDPRFRRLFEYWLGKAPPGGLPGRQHIDPLEMKPFLPYIRLLDIVREDGRLRFRYRLIGTHVADLHGISEIGHFVDMYALPDHYRAAFYPDMMHLIETKQPHFAIRKAPVRLDNFTAYHRLNLPLASNGVDVDMVLGLHIGVRTDGTLMEAGRDL